MMEQLKLAYINYRWFRVAACLGLLVCGVLLCLFSGGFPPWAWLFLFQVIPQIPRLWALQGAAILLPLFGLIMLSLALFVLWCALVSIAIKMIFYWWQTLHEHRDFARELQEAEQMVDRMVQQQVQQPPLSPLPISPVPLGPPPISPMPISSPPRMQYDERSEMQYRQAASAYPVSAGMMQAAAYMPQSAYASSPRVTVPLARTNTTPFLGEPLEQQPHYQATSALRNQLRLVRTANDDAASEPAHAAQASKPATAPIGTITDLDTIKDLDVYDTLPDMGPLSATSKLLEPLEEDERAIELRLLVGISLDPGIARKDNPNEDNLFAIQGMRPTEGGPEPVGLFVVADGMGGHANGREASQMAIHAMSDAIVPSLMRLSNDEEVFLELLKDGAHRANMAIYKRNRDQTNMMGTTLTAALIVGNNAYVVNVGDSRTYRYRAGEGLKQVTRDHSVVARLVEDGVISRDAIYTHPRRNQIYRCLGERATLEADVFVEPLQANDVLVLCSDGLWEMVRDGQIEEIIAASALQPSQISSDLVQAALAGGGADNVGVVVVCVADAENSPSAP